MAIRKLYEFDYTDRLVFRCVEGTALQYDTYSWQSVDSVLIGDSYITLSDSSGSFNEFITANEASRLSVHVNLYNESTSTVTESSDLGLYSVMSSGQTVAALRLSGIPEEQLEDAQQLLADGIVQLYEIKTNEKDADGNNVYLHLKANNDVHWQGYDWTGIPLLFEGYSSAQGDSYARPTLSIANPNGAFSTFVRDGALTRASVNRYIVLYDHIKKDKAIYQKKTWIIWAIKTLNKNLIQVELRNPMDGVNFDVPARMYIPPEFPFVEI